MERRPGNVPCQSEHARIRLSSVKNLSLTNLHKISIHFYTLQVRLLNSRAFPASPQTPWSTVNFTAPIQMPDRIATLIIPIFHFFNFQSLLCNLFLTGSSDSRENKKPLRNF